MDGTEGKSRMVHVRQKDIAKILEVSRVTVSKALNNATDISAEMKQKVKKLADELGYIPHHHARTLHLNKTNTVGVVVPDVSNSFFSFTVHGIMDSAAQNGYHVILTDSREDPAIERQNILTLLSMRVDGLLVAISKDTIDRGIFETIAKFKTPMVFFDRAIEDLGFSSVGIDDRLAAATVVEYAIQCGYKKIAHLAGSQKIAIGRDRYTGYLDILKKYNIPVRNDWIIEGSFDRESGYLGFNKLYKPDDCPEVIFAANDGIAMGAYKAIKEKGMRIPDDFGVIALGHADFAEIVSPSLTISASPPVIIGKTAMDLLEKEIREHESRYPQKILLNTHLIINESILERKN
jgi:LacI family transcriptional regulator